MMTFIRLRNLIDMGELFIFGRKLQDEAIKWLEDMLKAHNDMAKQIVELQEKIALCHNTIANFKDKLHRRNLQIADLRSDRAELLRLSALLGRLGYDLKGNKIV